MQPVILDADVASLSHKRKLTGPLATLDVKDYEDFRLHHGLRVLGTG